MDKRHSVVRLGAEVAWKRMKTNMAFDSRRTSLVSLMGDRRQSQRIHAEHSVHLSDHHGQHVPRLHTVHSAHLHDPPGHHYPRLHTEHSAHLFDHHGHRPLGVHDERAEHLLHPDEYATEYEMMASLALIKQFKHHHHHHHHHRHEHGSRRASQSTWTCSDTSICHHDHGQNNPLLRFRRAVRTVLTLLKATTSNSRGKQRRDSRVLSFAQYQDEILNNKRSNYGEDLTFDPLMYRAHRETLISNEAKTILSLDPSDRTEDQLHIALLALNAAVEAFSEFPITMQRSLVRVGWYEHFEAKRVIIRQGHMADNFYFILSGKALVTILETDKKTGESRANTVATLRKGNSFGELALMHGAKRSATVTCKDDVELLAVGREDFIDIFMHVEKNTEPEHIQFLRQIEILRGWPIDKLPWDDPKICLFTFFRRGVVMCKDSNKADWIYIIKTGSCQVLKRLLATKPNIPGLEQLQYSDVTDNKHRSWLPPHIHRGQHMRSAFSSLNNLQSLTGSSGEQLSSRREKLSEFYRGLPPIRPRTNTDIEALMEQHKHTLDQIYKMKHENFTPKKVRVKPNDKESKNKQKQSVFVQVQKLGPKDTFGLEHVAFSLMDKCTSVSLVSDGSEAILISKKFFLQHLSDDMRKKLRTSIQPYPTEESLQQKLQDMSNWEAFKTMTVTDYILFSKYVHDTLYL